MDWFSRHGHSKISPYVCTCTSGSETHPGDLPSVPGLFQAAASRAKKSRRGLRRARRAAPHIPRICPAARSSADLVSSSRLQSAHSVFGTQGGSSDLCLSSETLCLQIRWRVCLFCLVWFWFVMGGFTTFGFFYSWIPVIFNQSLLCRVVLCRLGCVQVESVPDAPLPPTRSSTTSQPACLSDSARGLVNLLPRSVVVWRRRGLRSEKLHCMIWCSQSWGFSFPSLGV